MVEITKVIPTMIQNINVNAMDFTAKSTKMPQKGRKISMGSMKIKKQTLLSLSSFFPLHIID